MRKCGDCGYLLFGDGETCNHCGAEVPLAAVGAGVRAPAATLSTPPAPPSAPPSVPPQQPFTGPVAHAGSPPPSPFATPASAPPVPEIWRGPSPLNAPPPPTSAPATEREVWRPATVVTAPPEQKSFAGRAIAIMLVVVIVGVGYTFVKSRTGLPSGTKDFVAGNGTPYTAPANAYTAKFPVAPTVQTEPVTVGNATVSVTLAAVTTDDYEMGTASMDLPVAVSPAQVDAILEEALKGGIGKVDGDLVSKQRIERGGLPAIDAKFKAPDGYSARVMVILASTRVYVLFVHAKSGTDKLFDALEESFIPAPASGV